jgi:hypothetical protein
MQRDKSVADERDFITRSQSMAEKMYGRPATVEEMTREFAGYGPSRRVMSLDRLDDDIVCDEPLTLNGARRLAETVVCRRAFGDIHEAMRKAGR